MSIISTCYGKFTEPVYTGCICKIHPAASRYDGCPEHGLQPLTDHDKNLRQPFKRGALLKVLPRMTADEVAAAERELPESWRPTVRAAWKKCR